MAGMVWDRAVSLTSLKSLAKRLFETSREAAGPRLQILVQRFDSASGLQGLRPRRRTPCSPVAQLVERAAVNRLVAGSSPARGANKVKALGHETPSALMLFSEQDNFWGNSTHKSQRARIVKLTATSEKGMKRDLVDR